MEKPDVFVMNPDRTLGKQMSGDAFVKAYYPELLEKKTDSPSTGPIVQPGPVAPPVVEQPPLVPPVPETPSVLAYEWKDLGKGRNTGCLVYLVYFPDQPRIVEDYTTLGRWRLEKFGVCGFDFPIDLLPGVEQPRGPSTGNYGMNTPADFVCPADCVEGNWPSGNDGKPGRKFFVWKKSKLNTEPAVKPDVVTPAPKPETPDRVVTIEDGLKNFTISETGSATVDGQSTTYIQTA